MPPSGSRRRRCVVRARISTFSSVALGRVGRIEGVVHAAGAGVDVEPRGGARPDADLDVAGAGLEHRRAAHDRADADVAVRRLRDHAALRDVDRDAAVGGLDAQVAAGDADGRGAVGVLDHGAAVERADADLTGAGGDVGVPGRVADGDVAGSALDVQRRRRCRARSGRARTSSGQSPRRPVTSKSAIALVALSCEPAGSSIVTSIEPPWLRGDHGAELGRLDQQRAVRRTRRGSARPRARPPYWQGPMDAPPRRWWRRRRR